VALAPGKRTKTPMRNPVDGLGRPLLIERDDLLAALDRAADRQVTVVTAPAGSGKTSLLRAWADRQRGRSRLAMVQVQRDQHDAQLFWLALFKAVRELSGTPSNSSVDPAAASPDFSGTAIVDRILAELAEQGAHGDRVVVAIDDVHQLTSPNTTAHLTRLLTSLPPGAHVILATRRDLPLRLHRLRLAGELAELRATDLRFTERETGELLVASAVTLSDANAFVVSLDPERTWFRYHHLFADLLRLELHRKLPDAVGVLHRRAADWFTAQGRIVEAVRHRQADGDWSGAAALLGDHSFGMMLDGQEETVQGLLQAFPQHAAESAYPELCVARAMIDLVHNRIEDAAAHLTITDACLGSVPADRRLRLRAAISSLQLSLARHRAEHAEFMRHAEALASPPGGASQEEIALGSELRVVALFNLGTAEAWYLGHPDGERYLREGAELAREIGRPFLEVACLAQLGFATKLSSFASARRHCEEAIALAEEHGWGTAAILGPALVTLACTMVWAGESNDAELVLRRADVVLERANEAGIRTLFHLVKGMLRAGRGRLSEAHEEFATALALQSQFTDPHALAGYVTGWTLATRARLGSTVEARADIEALDGPLADSAELRNARATICLAEDDPAGALTALEPVIDGSARAVHVATIVEAQLLCALAYHELGDRGRVIEAVEQALALAEPERLILPFVMTGAGGLLETFPRRESAHAALLTDILDVVHGSSAERAIAPLPPVQELSPTELRVLRYLPTNLSRLEIAGELSVSVNTVATHVRNIYAKLQVSGRSSAVQRARELRLLANGPTP